MLTENRRLLYLGNQEAITGHANGNLRRCCSGHRASGCDVAHSRALDGKPVIAGTCRRF